MYPSDTILPPRRHAAPSPRDPRWRRWPSARAVAVWAIVVAALGTFLFLYRALDGVAVGVSPDWLLIYLEEMTGALGAGVLFVGWWWLVDRLPFDESPAPGSPGRLQRVGLYALAFLAYSFVHTLFNWASRTALVAWVGRGVYDYGRFPERFLMEGPIDLVASALMVGGLHAGRRLARAREREVAAARLEESLARAELRNLRLQLQPHFLFNTLHAVSATMYDDPVAADELLDRLAELLRASLRTARDDEVPLAEELHSVDAYLSILTARFGDRLRIDRQIDDGVLGVFVPSMLLQPLVENAVRHGGLETADAMAAGDGRCRVTIRAGRTPGVDDRLSLEVIDDGVGPSAGGGSAPDATLDERSLGVGLRSTRERLELLYGEAHRLEVGAAQEPAEVERAGFRVAIELPARTGPS
ncbi:MAG: histidine kinase [Acidobacteriota bacterium]